MKAPPREAECSLLGYLIEHSGVEILQISPSKECAFIDSRVLFAHHKYDFLTGSVLGPGLWSRSTSG